MLQFHNAPPLGERERVRATLAQIVPKEWELDLETTLSSLTESWTTVRLLCSNRPLKGFEPVFDQIHMNTGRFASFNHSSVAIIDDVERVRKIQAALPSGVTLLALRWKPFSDFYGLELSGPRPSRKELAEVRAILGRPLIVTRPVRPPPHKSEDEVRGPAALVWPRSVIAPSPALVQQAQVTPYGACSSVGRSCFLFELAGSRVLVDCGASMNDLAPPEISNEVIRSLDCVVLSHAHLDHSGMLPWLYARGCRAPLVVSKLGFELLPMLLGDSLRLRGWQDKNNAFGSKDIQLCLKHAYPLDFNQEQQINQNVSLELLPAGHILGAAMVLFKCAHPNGSHSVLYGGDVSIDGSRSLRDAIQMPAVDTLMIEATYGDREHHDRRESEIQLLSLAEGCCRAGGTVIIPVFSVGRAQEILAVLTESELLGRARGKFAVFVDGGMLQRANRIYLKSLSENGDRYHPFVETLKYALDPNRRFITPVRSNLRGELLRNDEPKIIVTSSGMGNGPARTYIQHLGKKEETLIVFVGYQASGSLGAELLGTKPVSGSRHIVMDGSDTNIKARVEKVGFSGHADRKQLLEVVRQTNARKVIPIHGDPSAVKALGGAIEAGFPNVSVVYPSVGESIGL